MPKKRDCKPIRYFLATGLKPCRFAAKFNGKVMRANPEHIDLNGESETWKGD